MEQIDESHEYTRNRTFHDLESAYPVHTSEDVLGHEAISMANKHAAVVQEMSLVHEDSQEYESYGKFEKILSLEVVAEVEDIRQELSELSKDDEYHLRLYMNMEAPYSHIGTMLYIAEKKVGHKLSWKDWLVKHATDDELLAFLQYHNHVIEKQQASAEAQETLSEQKAGFIRVVDEFYEEGILVQPKDGIDVDQVKLVIGDIFDMAMQERMGYYQVGQNEIAIQQAYSSQPHQRSEELVYNVMTVSTHELVHAVIGESYKQFDTPIAARWINEALTEELSHSIDVKNGVFDDDIIYADERRLLNVLLGRHDKDVGYRYALKAFSGDLDDRMALLEYLDDAWGATDVLDKINQAVTLAELSFDESSDATDRERERAALRVVLRRLKDNPASIFVQYEDAMALLDLAVTQNETFNRIAE